MTFAVYSADPAFVMERTESPVGATPTPANRDIVTRRDVAKRLNVTVKTISRWVKQGILCPLTTRPFQLYLWEDVRQHICEKLGAYGTHMIATAPVPTPPRPMCYDCPHNPKKRKTKRTK